MERIKAYLIVCFCCVAALCGLSALPAMAAVPADITAPVVDPEPGRPDRAVQDLMQSIMQERQQLIQSLLTTTAQNLDVYWKDSEAINVFATKHPAQGEPATQEERENSKYRQEDMRENMNEARETILLLGKLRAVEAIPLLIKNLEFANGGGSYIREEFSCLGALIDIGSPALAPLLTAAANTDDAALRRLISYAFINIIRRDAAMAYIKSQAPPNLSAAQREHLNALMQDISHLPDALLD